MRVAGLVVPTASLAVRRRISHFP